MQHPSLVDVEIDVDVEPLTREIFVRTAAEERRVGDQVRDARQCGHRLQERRGIDVPVERRVERADTGDPFDDRLASDAAVLVLRIPVAERGKVAQQRFARVRLEKAVDDDVSKGFSGLERFAQRVGGGERLRADHRAMVSAIRRGYFG